MEFRMFLFPIGIEDILFYTNERGRGFLDAVFRVGSDFGSRQGLAVTGELPSGVAGSN